MCVLGLKNLIIDGWHHRTDAASQLRLGGGDVCPNLAVKGYRAAFYKQFLTPSHQRHLVAFFNWS